jgi:ubiquitin-conjugating enzyme
VNQQNRETRLKADHELLTALAAASTIFTCEPSGEPPDRYTLTFRGKGLGRDAASQSDIVPIELHQIDLRMSYSYPNSPPDIRWLTPIWHPNVSFSGFVNLADIGLAWTKEIPIDLVCERLWDIARGEIRNLNKATNYAAKNWFEKECAFSLPIDARPLRDKVVGSGSNIVRYERRVGDGVQLYGASATGEVMIIDESTPTPQIPQRQPYVPVVRRRPRGDDDVLYIGPE